MLMSEQGGAQRCEMLPKEKYSIVVEYTQNRPRYEMGSTYPVDCETCWLSGVIFSSRLLLVARATEFLRSAHSVFLRRNALSQLSIKNAIINLLRLTIHLDELIYSRASLFVFLQFFFFLLLEDPCTKRIAQTELIRNRSAVTEVIMYVLYV